MPSKQEAIADRHCQQEQQRELLVARDQGLAAVVGQHLTAAWRARAVGIRQATPARES